MELRLYTSAFCGPCVQAKRVIDEAERLVPAVEFRRLDVVRDEPAAEADDIRSTPTVVIRDDAGREVFRASGVPSVNQVLYAIAQRL